MPNIPNLPGVPPLASYIANAAILIFGDLISLLFGGPSQWGIFLDGEQVIEADSTVSFELRQDLPISDYPTEEGGFQSYDKVQLPTDIRVRMSRGGSIFDRQAFLASIDAVMNTTDLYDIVTPEAVYLDYNFTHRDLKRTATAGAGLIIVDLWLQEVRVTSTSTFTNTQQPSEAGRQNIGNVQPQTPSAAVPQYFTSADWEGAG